jgi:protein-S-isoprenylcysteine O-methyltransferase
MSQRRFPFVAAGTVALLLGLVAVGAAWTQSEAMGRGLGPYLMLLGAFHLLEFSGTALLRPAQLSFQSFAFNGLPYAAAIALGLVEHVLEADALSGYAMASDIRVLGLAVAGLALGLRIWAVVAASSSFDHVVHTELGADHTLVTQGPYRWLRHPSYTGYYWFAIGGQIILHNPITLCVHAIVLARFFRQRLAVEESALERRFGSEYARFRKRRFLLIPGVGC